MSEKPTRKATDYAVESREARNRSVFRPQMKIGSRKTLRSYTIQADRCRKRRFQYKRILLGPVLGDALFTAGGTGTVHWCECPIRRYVRDECDTRQAPKDS